MFNNIDEAEGICYNIANRKRLMPNRKSICRRKRQEESAMKCPVCKDVTLLMSEKNGVEIDYCPECRGIWLDRGELDKIIQRAKEIERDYDRDDDGYHRDYDRQRYQSRDKEYDRDYRKEKDRYDDSYYRKKKKKSSMFGELFEMFGGEGD